MMLVLLFVHLRHDGITEVTKNRVGQERHVPSKSSLQGPVSVLNNGKCSSLLPYFPPVPMTQSSCHATMGEVAHPPGG